MRRLGELLTLLGVLLGVLVAVAIVIHVGPSASWLINVALAKLTLVAAGGLIGAGAVAIRLDNRERSKKISEKRQPPTLT